MAHSVPPLDAQQVAALLIEIGRRLELGGESIFKCRAYYTAAENIQALPSPLADLVSQGKLRTIPGVGEAIAEKIIKLHKTGTHPMLEDMRKEIPSGVLDLFKVPGLGPKKILVLYQELKVASLAELEEACKSGKLADCKGLGAALQKKVLQALEFLSKGQGLRRIHEATEILEAAAERLRKSHPDLKRVAIAGPLRRGCELVDDLCLVAEDSGKTLADAGDVRIVFSDADHYGIRFIFATGSADHVEALQAHAGSQGFKLTPEGLFDKRGKEIVCKNEIDVYAALGLEYIDPELREGLPINGAKSEIELAAAKEMPRLIELRELKGILHSHTDSSDGSETLETMAEETRKRGLQYYGVCDHSQSAGYAGGMKDDKIREQHRMADELNARYTKEGATFRIFKGVESDILEKGELDYPESTLKKFDFIVASIHSRFTLDPEAQTQRLINAVSNPYTTILGHMTGRLLLRREGYKFDIDAVLQACAKHGVVVEINANPHRLDLDWRWHQRALELGCMLSINPDAHAIEELDLMRWGISIARKGAVPKERLLNCMSLDEITAYFEKRNKR